jgi:hypothetical protein
MLPGRRFAVFHARVQAEQRVPRGVVFETDVRSGTLAMRNSEITDNGWPAGDTRRMTVLTWNRWQASGNRRFVRLLCNGGGGGEGGRRNYCCHGEPWSAESL